MFSIRRMSTCRESFLATLAIILHVFLLISAGVIHLSTRRLPFHQQLIIDTDDY